MKSVCLKADVRSVMIVLRNFRVAMIGSRTLHKNPENHKDVALCYKVCYRFAELGISFTSGLCGLGMDAIAQRAYSQAVNDGKAFLSQFEVYVSRKDDIDKSRLPNRHLAIIKNPSLKKELEDLASSLHGNWSNCDSYARGMHHRNCHEILGYHLNNPVKAVITWCELDNFGDYVGGSRTALKLAERYRIPIFNLNTPDKKKVLAEIHDFLRWHEIVG